MTSALVVLGAGQIGQAELVLLTDLRPYDANCGGQVLCRKQV